jgi:hypothetical protein
VAMYNRRVKTLRSQLLGYTQPTEYAEVKCGLS